MPVHYAIDLDRQRLHTTCSGYVTFPEVAQHFQELRNDPQFRDSLDVLLDLSGCTSLPTPDQLRDVVDQIASLGGRWRFGACAMITTDEALYGITRIFEVYAREVFTRSEIFHSVPEGDRWLDSLQALKKTS